MLIKFPTGFVINLNHYQVFHHLNCDVFFYPANTSNKTYKHSCATPTEAEDFVNDVMYHYGNDKKIFIVE